VLAGRDVNILAGRATQDVDAASKHTDKGFMSKRTVTTTDQLHSTTAVGPAWTAAPSTCRLAAT